MFFFIDLYIHSLKNNSKWARHVDQDVRSSEEGHLVQTQEIHGNEKKPGWLGYVYRGLYYLVM